MMEELATGASPALVTLPAEIDITNARDVRCQLNAAALRPGVGIVIADMTATCFCDSTGIRALLLAHQRAARSGAELRLLRPGDAVRRVLKVMGADQVLAIYDSVGDAMRPRPRTMV
jgi:anti-sigma B factor antagonist